MIWIINFFQLLWINVKRHFFKELILGFGVIFSTIILIIGFTLSNSLEKIYKTNMINNIPIDQLVISKKKHSKFDSKINLGITQFQNSKNINYITKDVIKDIKNIKEIKEVIPISKANFPISLLIKMKAPLPQEYFFLEPPVIGLPNKMAQFHLRKHLNFDLLQKIKKKFPKGFHKNNNIIPILIPYYVKKIIVNFFKNNNLLELNLIELSQFLNINIIMNRSFIIKSKDKSEYSSKAIKVQVIGFLDSELTSGIAVPQDFLEEEKTKIFKRVIGYESLIIKLKNIKNISSTKFKLKNIMNKYNLIFEEESVFQKLTKLLKEFFIYFKFIMTTLSFFVLLITGIGIIYAFLYLFFQREKEMNLYRFFGASRLEIGVIILSEAFLLGIFSSFIGYILSYFLIKNITKYISNVLNLLPESIRKLLFNIELEKFITFNVFDNIILSFMILIFCLISGLIPSIIGSFRGINLNK